MATKKKRTLDELKEDNPDVAAAANADKKLKQATENKEKNKDKSKSGDDSKKEENSKGKEKDLTHIKWEEQLEYRVGTCLDVLFHTFISRMINDKEGNPDTKKMFELLQKYDIVLQFFSIVSHICQADGKMGEKEKTFIEAASHFWRMPDVKLDEAFKGKDLSDEFVVSIQKYWQEACPDLTEAEMVTRVNSFKNWVITYAIAAATQDGLIKKEYKAAAKMAKKLGLNEKCVDDNINIIKAEKALATVVRSKFLKTKIDENSNS